MLWKIMTFMALMGILAVAQTASICNFGTIANGTVVETQAVSNTITSCSMDYVTFQSSMVALIAVVDSTVSEGGLLKVIFGDALFAFRIQSTNFLQDARVEFEGTPQKGTGITIIGNSFDVRTPRYGNSIAVDLTRISIVPSYFVIEVRDSVFNIAAEESAGSAGVIAAVAYTPSSIEGLQNSITLSGSTITLNTSDVVAYGLYVSTSNSLAFRISAVKNTVRRQRNDLGAAKATAFYLSFPDGDGNHSAVQKLDVNANIVDRIKTMISYYGGVTEVDISGNSHSHYAQLSNNVSVINVLGSIVSFTRNTLTTFYEEWNPQSTYGNPILSVVTSQVLPTHTIKISTNDFYASRFISTPILFPGSTNLLNNSSVSIVSNNFGTNQVGDTSLPMSSFAISLSSPPRLVDLGIVYICSNVWPAVFSVATTTVTTTATTSNMISSSTSATTTTSTRAAVASSDAISVYVALQDRPTNLSFTGGQCPIYTLDVTRVPNAVPRSLLSTSLSIQAVIVSVMLGLILVM